MATVLPVAAMAGAVAMALLDAEDAIVLPV